MSHPPSISPNESAELVPAAEVSSTPVGHQGTNVDITERSAWSPSAAMAAVGLLAAIIGLAAGIGLVISSASAADSASAGESTALPMVGVIGGIVLIVLATLALTCIRVINPGHTQVVQFFGRYLGTNRNNGLTMVVPFAKTSKVSVRVRNFETNEIKVNDLSGNPIVIGAIIVWQVADTAKASFSVENMEQFIHSQAESALRHVATTKPYISNDPAVVSLSGSTDDVSAELAHEVAQRVSVAGLEVVEARISALSYAPEIAGAMLQRQQAQAVVDAREQIVDGAVFMVQSALDQLEARDIVELDPERRAAMVSNLLVVLCSDSATQPVVNTGGLYS